MQIHATHQSLRKPECALISPRMRSPQATPAAAPQSCQTRDRGKTRSSRPIRSSSLVQRKWMVWQMVWAHRVSLALWPRLAPTRRLGRQPRSALRFLVRHSRQRQLQTPQNQSRCRAQTRSLPGSAPQKAPAKHRQDCGHGARATTAPAQRPRLLSN